MSTLTLQIPDPVLRRGRVSELKRIFQGNDLTVDPVERHLPDIIPITESTPSPTNSVSTIDTVATLNTPFPPVTPLSPSPSTPHSRRQLRYSRAEQALAVTLSSLPPPRTTLELQITALEQLTALLSARAEDAQQHAAKLRACLSDRDRARDLDPVEFRSLQRERWMEEKRRESVWRDKQAVQTQLALLSSRVDNEDENVDGNVDGDVGRDGDEDEDRSRTQHHANLDMFFQQSHTRVPLAFERRPATCASTIGYPAPTRRRTMSKASPLHLRPSSMLAFIYPANGRIRKGSLLKARQRKERPKDDDKENVRGEELSKKLPLTRAGVQNDSDAHVPSMISNIRPHSPAMLETATESTTSLLTAPSPSPSPVADYYVPPTPDGTGTGVALIQPSPAPRTRAELLAQLEFDETTIQLPDYARDLMDAFGRPDHEPSVAFSDPNTASHQGHSKMRRKRYLSGPIDSRERSARRSIFSVYPVSALKKSSLNLHLRGESLASPSSRTGHGEVHSHDWLNTAPRVELPDFGEDTTARMRTTSVPVRASRDGHAEARPSEEPLSARLRKRFSALGRK